MPDTPVTHRHDLPNRFLFIHRPQFLRFDPLKDGTNPFPLLNPLFRRYCHVALPNLFHTEARSLGVFGGHGVTALPHPVIALRSIPAFISNPSCFFVPFVVKK